MNLNFIKIVFSLIVLLLAEYELVWKVKKNADFIAIDRLEQVYLYENFNLEKYDKNGNFLHVFNNRMNGKISGFDASDPYMLLIYYQDINRIVFLDNQLAPIGHPIDLDAYELYRVAKVCKSKNFAVWIYDDFDNRLIHYGFNPKGIISEINLALLDVDKVQYMCEWGNNLFLSTGKELLVFDILGNFIRQLELKIPNSFQVVNNKIIYFSQGKILIYGIDDKQQDSLSLDFIADIKDALFQNNCIIIRKNGEVLKYCKRN